MAALPASRVAASSVTPRVAPEFLPALLSGSKPVRGKVESGEAVVIPWSALLFRRRADVEGRDAPHLRPQGPAVPHRCDRRGMGAGLPLRGCRAKQVGAAPG